MLRPFDRGINFRTPFSFVRNSKVRFRRKTGVPSFGNTIFHFKLTDTFFVCLSRHYRFFVNLNNSLFQMLFEVASTENRVLTPELIRTIGLDPKGDLRFLSDLVDLYGINVLIPEPKCCPFYPSWEQSTLQTTHSSEKIGEGRTWRRHDVLTSKTQRESTLALLYICSKCARQE